MSELQTELIQIINKKFQGIALRKQENLKIKQAALQATCFAYIG
jgi:hypothetical protein